MSTPRTPDDDPESLQHREMMKRSVASYLGYLRALASAWTGGRTPDASDAVHQVLMNTIDLISRSNLIIDEENIRAYLARALRNRLIDEDRRGRDEPLPEVEPADPALKSPSSALSLKENLARLRRAIDSLAPADRELIEWRDMNGMTFREIGERRNYSESYAIRAHREARNRLVRTFKRG